jgi:hypothetical protein
MLSTAPSFSAIALELSTALNGRIPVGAFHFAFNSVVRPQKSIFCPPTFDRSSQRSI